MREKIAIKSSVVGILCKTVSFIISFAISKFFMKYLGVEIRGINGVFANFLGFLQLAEMGFGTAIIYALYEPIHKQEIGQVKALMRFYRTIYRVVGTVVLVGGCIFIPMIPFFIEETTYDFSYIVLVYLIQLATSASTYFLSYKRNLMYADQKQYLATFIDTLAAIVCGIIKIFVIIYTKNYVAYLIIQVVQNVGSNIIINAYCNRKYPYLKEKITEKYAKTEELKKNVKNLMIGRIGGWVYSSTDNLIISKFSGVIKVGLLSNYYILIAMIKGILDSMFESMRPIIGNYIVATDDKKEVFRVFRTYSFIRYVVASIATVGFVLLANPVVTVWLGGEFVVEWILVIWFAVDLYIHLVHSALADFVNVLGLFKDDRNMTIIGSVVNLALSLGLIPLFGTAGVLIGTAVAQTFYWGYRGYIVFNNYFKMGVARYVFTMARYILVTVLEIAGLFFLFRLEFFSGTGLLMVLIKGIICVCVSILGSVVTNLGTDELNYAYSIVSRNILKRSTNIK